MPSTAPSHAVRDHDLRDPALFLDPRPLLHRMREEEPVYWSHQLESWVLTSYQDVCAALRDPRLSVVEELKRMEGLPTSDQLVPTLLRAGLRAFRDRGGAWERYWRRIRQTGPDGEVLWDGDSAEERDWAVGLASQLPRQRRRRGGAHPHERDRPGQRHEGRAALLRGVMRAGRASSVGTHVHIEGLSRPVAKLHRWTRHPIQGVSPSCHFNVTLAGTIGSRKNCQ
ncbi:hypothetical protein WME94_28000 [Sorangium sp. So ce429]